MAVNRNLVRTVMTIVGTAGPVVATYLREHPEIAQEVQATVTKLLRRRSSGPAGMRQTIEVLREQVAYLADSADDGTEAARAQDWSRRLDNLDHAVAMLHDTASRREVKVVRQRLHALRGEILAAFVAEQADDAEQRRLGR
ncbi:hypothetical protein [Actinotalea caeni]|uniref:hypothetical protein n=1 Tax=Actinotalea caeni TaxID=1348467 RepID=UPI0012E169C6|nr:hypothetical protein [Actinotalea caeni]